MMLCTSPSTSVSKSRAFTFVLITSAPTLRDITSPPSLAASTATCFAVRTSVGGVRRLESCSHLEHGLQRGPIGCSRRGYDVPVKSRARIMSLMDFSTAKMRLHSPRRAHDGGSRHHAFGSYHVGRSRVRRERSFEMSARQPKARDVSPHELRERVTG